MPTRSDMVAVYIARRVARAWEFLQLRRRDDDYLGGTWSTVYGMMEPGETAWQAALRELHEETGIRPAEFFRIPTVRSFYTAANDTLWHVPAFCVMVANDVTIKLNNEHAAFRWAPRDRIEQMFLWATDRAAIEEIMEELLSPASAARDYLRIDIPKS